MTELFDKYGHPIKVLINPDCPSDLFDKSGRPHIVVENVDGIDLSTGEFLAALLKGGNLLHIPTNAGWTGTFVGTGSVIEEGPFNSRIGTGGDASSSAKLHTWAPGFGEGILWYNINWDKKIYIIFNLTRYASAANAIGRLQLKAVSTEGAMGNKGLGIRIDDLALKGESYGASLGVIDLATTLTDNRGYRMTIIHYPASKVEWYVNGVLKGTQSDTNKIPSGVTAVSLVFSIINGASAFGVLMALMQPKIWQEA